MKTLIFTLVLTVIALCIHYPTKGQNVNTEAKKIFRAYNLAEEGISNNNPKALLKATNLLITIELEPLSSINDSTSATIPDLLDVKYLLDYAETLSKNNPRTLKKIQHLRNKNSLQPRNAGIDYNTEARKYQIPANGSRIIKFEFLKDEEAVFTHQDAEVITLKINYESHNLSSKLSNISRNPLVSKSTSFIAPISGEYQIVLQNTQNTATSCLITLQRKGL